MRQHQLESHIAGREAQYTPQHIKPPHQDHNMTQIPLSLSNSPSTISIRKIENGAHIEILSSVDGKPR